MQPVVLLLQLLQFLPAAISRLLLQLRLLPALAAAAGTAQPLQSLAEEPHLSLIYGIQLPLPLPLLLVYQREITR